MAQGQVSPTSGLLLLQWGVACPHPPVPLPDTWAEHLTPWRLTLAHVFHNRDPRVEAVTVIYLPIELPWGWLWRLIPFLFVSLIFPEFVPVEEWLLDSQALWGLRSPVGEILSTSKEKQYLLLQRDKPSIAMDTESTYSGYSYYSSHSKKSHRQGYVSSCLLHFSSGGGICRFLRLPGLTFLIPLGGASTGISVHWCMRSWAFRTF